MADDAGRGPGDKVLAAKNGWSVNDADLSQKSDEIGCIIVEKHLKNLLICNIIVPIVFHIGKF